MNRKKLIFAGIWSLFTVAVSVATANALQPTPPPTKDIVMVDIQKIIRTKAAQIAQSGNGETPSQQQQAIMAKFTDSLNTRLAHIAEDANVLIVVKQAVAAGVAQDITPLILEDL